MKTVPAVIKGFVLILICCCFHFSSFARDKQVDSLETLLKVEKSDTARINLLNALASAYLNENPDYAEVLAKSALNSSEKISFTKGRCESLSVLGFIYMYKPDYPKALECYNTGLSLAKEQNEKLLICKISNRMGVLYQYMGNFERASECAFAALKIASELEDKYLLASINNNIGVIYSNLKDNKRALIYFGDSYRFSAQMNDSNAMAVDLNNIGNQYAELSMYDSAYIYLKSALLLYTEIQSPAGIAYAYSSMADLFEKQKKYEQQKVLLLKVIALQQKVNNADVYSDLGNCYLHLGALDSAQHYLLLGLEGAEKNGLSENTIQTYLGLFDLYEKKKEYQTALEYYRKSVTLRDSIIGADTKSKIENSRIIYEEDQKEKIRQLNDQQKEAEHTAELHTRNVILYAVSFCMVLLVLFSLFVFRSYQQKKRSNEELSEKNHTIELQKKIVEEKNKDITDSINYAKRIQEAMLPDKDYKFSLFSDVFIFFRPKDLVSGDFYWYTQKNGKKLIAAVDCTGHGVPGAFMSMIGNVFLNEIVNEKGITQPGMILDELRNLVIGALKQTGEAGAQKDGMDISLLSFSDEQVGWAGANNPLWLVKKNELIVVPGDKSPIGFHLGNDIPFTNHDFKIEKGDCLYIFSDGYADQFGGDKGKKFNLKQLKELILSVHQRPMNEQEEMLAQAFDNWKGELDQIDDVLLIGIRV